MTKNQRQSLHGVLVVDKPSGPTSHDVVSWARRALNTRAVGHAGTLDPIATGVLVMGIGEGTKLTPYLTAQEKEYETRIALGAETTSLDAQGDVIESAPVPRLDRKVVVEATRSFVGTYLQRAPAVSAIKRDGVALHERVRRGEDVVAPEREVTCHSIEILDLGEAEIVLRVRCEKGFYVRSLGRDLARALNTRGHLTMLRRTRSGQFEVASAVSGDLLESARHEEAVRPQIAAQLLTIAQALEWMPRAILSEGEADSVRHGRLIATELSEVGPIAAVDASGHPLAIVESVRGKLRVLRGLNAPRSVE